MIFVLAMVLLGLDLLFVGIFLYVLNHRYDVHLHKSKPSDAAAAS